MREGTDCAVDAIAEEEEEEEEEEEKEALCRFTRSDSSEMVVP